MGGIRFLLRQSHSDAVFRMTQKYYAASLNLEELVFGGVRDRVKTRFSGRIVQETLGS
jgi:hypothetical protein